MGIVDSIKGSLSGDKSSSSSKNTGTAGMTGQTTTSGNTTTGATTAGATTRSAAANTGATSGVTSPTSGVTSPTSGVTSPTSGGMTGATTGANTGVSTGAEALADGQPSEYVVDDRIGGTHTRNVKDAVTNETVQRHAHHEVTPVVERVRDETEIHQKIQPVLAEEHHHTHHRHEAAAVHRERGEDISEEVAAKYRAQGQVEGQRIIGDQTHSTEVHAPKIHEQVKKHIIEEIQPVIERQTHQTEHHHTIQPITEHITHAPRVHDAVVNEPISITEFTGNNAGLKSHAAQDVIVDERRA